MLRTLKRRFVFLSVAAVTAVLLVILSAINIANYIQINRHADERLDLILANGGFFPKEPRPGRDMTPETPYEARYFTVIFDGSGTPVFIHTGSIAAITPERAVELASDAPVIPTEPLDVSEIFSDKDTESSISTDGAALIELSDGDIAVILRATSA